MQHYFIFNGVNSLSKGIIMKAVPDFVRPEERVEVVQIPGRTGDLTLTQGDDVYNSYTYAIEVAIPTAKLLEVQSWLRGTGYLTFSTRADKKQEARVVKSFTMKRVSRNIAYYNTTITFNAQPYFLPMSEQGITLSAGDNSYTCTGDVECMPDFVIDAGNNDFSISVGDEALNVLASSAPTVASTDAWLVDTLNCEVSLINKTTGDIKALYTQYSSGSFPRIYPGTNTIAIGGTVTSAKMQPNTRFL